jgi:hypothetical protein
MAVRKKVTKKKGKKLSGIVPAASLREYGLDRQEIQNLSVDDLNEIGLMFQELHARKRGKKHTGAGGMCTTGMCTTAAGMCTTGMCTTAAGMCTTGMCTTA